MSEKRLYNFNELSYEAQRLAIKISDSSYEILSEDADALYSKEGMFVKYL